MPTRGGWSAGSGRASWAGSLAHSAAIGRPHWGITTSNAAAVRIPRLEAYIAAARRGADVELMLDAFFDETASAVSNAATCGIM